MNIFNFEHKMAKKRQSFQVEREMIQLIDSPNKLIAYKWFIIRRILTLLIKVVGFIIIANLSPELISEYVKNSWGG